MLGGTDGALDPALSHCWLVWSCLEKAWWFRNGFTHDIKQAGRFNLIDAREFTKEVRFGVLQNNIIQPSPELVSWLLRPVSVPGYWDVGNAGAWPAGVGYPNKK